MVYPEVAVALKHPLFSFRLHFWVVVAEVSSPGPEFHAEVGVVTFSTLPVVEVPAAVQVEQAAAELAVSISRAALLQKLLSRQLKSHLSKTCPNICPTERDMDDTPSHRH